MKRVVVGLVLVISLVAAGCQRVPGAGSASASASASAAGARASMAASPSASGSYTAGGNGY
jgi:predicted small secreted protein